MVTERGYGFLVLCPGFQLTGLLLATAPGLGLIAYAEIKLVTRGTSQREREGKATVCSVCFLLDSFEFGLWLFHAHSEPVCRNKQTRGIWRNQPRQGAACYFRPVYLVPLEP